MRSLSADDGRILQIREVGPAFLPWKKRNILFSHRESREVSDFRTSDDTRPLSA